MTKNTRKFAATVVSEPKPVQTRSVREAEEMNSIIFKMEYDVKYFGGQLDTWKDKFSIDPAYAFEWSQQAFNAAGSLNAAKWISENIEYLRKSSDEYSRRTDGQIIKILHIKLYVDVVEKAKWPTSSTSQPSNLISLCINSAKAEWLERLERSLERLARGDE